MIEVTTPTEATDIPTSTVEGTQSAPTAPIEQVPEPDKTAVNLKIWAKTSAEAREAKAKVAELQAKVDELSKVAPDAESALNAKLLELLKAPGTAKRLVTDGGRTFDDIVAELTDIPVEDPAVTATNKRLEALEAERTAEKEQRVKADKDAEDARINEAIQSGRKEVLDFATKNTETQPDGTPRWAIAHSRPEFIEETRASVVAFMVKNKEKHPDGFAKDVVEKLVAQALDKLELRERDKLKPLLSKLSGTVTAPTNKTAENSVSRITRTENPFESKQPKTITSELKGPMPTKTIKPRYSSGPRSIRYTD